MMLSLTSSGYLAAVNTQKTFSRKNKTTLILNNSLSTFSRKSKTFILNNSLSHSAESLVQAIESSQRLFVERLTRYIDRSILSSPLYADLTKALGFFYSMKEKRVLPNIQFDKFIRHMETLSGMKPNIFTYTKGKLEAACVMFTTTKDVGGTPDGFSYNHFCFVTCKDGRLEEPYVLLPNMLELGLLPHSLTYDALIHVCHGGPKAIEYKHVMISKGINPSLFTYNLLIDVLFGWGYECEAQHVIQEMQEKGIKPDVYTYNNIISGHFKAGDHDKAIAVYEEMLDKRIQPTRVTYNNLMTGYLCHVNDAEMKVRELFYEMKARGIEPDHISYNLYLGNSIAGCDLEEAYRVRDEMLKNGFHPKWPLILGLSLVGHFEHGEQLLKEMVSKGICTPHDIKFLSLNND